MNEKIRDLDKIAKEVIEDDELMGAIRKELVNRANDYSAKVGMFNQGMKEGTEKGDKECQIKVAKEMLKMGFDLEKISQATELSKEEIEKLKK